MAIETNFPITKDYTSLTGDTAAPAGGKKWRVQPWGADCQISYGTSSTPPEESHKGFTMEEHSTHTITLSAGQFAHVRNPRNGNSGILVMMEVV